MSELRMIAESFTEIELADKKYKIGNKKYKIGKLTIGDFADFEDFVANDRKNRIIETAKEVYGENMPDSVLDKALAPPTDKEIETQQGSIKGIRFLLWRAMLKHNPNMTEEEVAGMIHLDDLPKITQAIMPTTSKKNKRAKPPRKPR